jgi:hypothetical protein
MYFVPFLTQNEIISLHRIMRLVSVMEVVFTARYDLNS